MNHDFSLMDDTLAGIELYLQWLEDTKADYLEFPMLQSRLDIEIKRVHKMREEKSLTSKHI